MKTWVIGNWRMKSAAGALVMATALTAACSSGNNNNSNSNANTSKPATQAATVAPSAPAAASAAATRAASPAAPVAGSPAATRAGSPAAAAAGAVTTTSPAADLRVTLDRLLSEHADLAIVAMQKGYDGAPDFAMAAAQLDKNTTDLTKAIASVYGDAGGMKFQQLWKAHIGMFVD